MLEKHYILKYDTLNNGYNLDLGGNGIRGYKHTDEEIEKMRKIQDPLVVLQFDPQYNLIKRWIGGTSHIYKTLGYTQECIKLRCEHRINVMSTYKGSYWIYEKEFCSSKFSWEGYLSNIKIFSTYKKQKKYLSKTIYQYDVFYNLIKSWNVSDLKKSNYNLSKIYKICKHIGEINIYRSSFWVFNKDDIFDKYFQIPIRTTRKYKGYSVIKVNLSGEIVKTYSSINIAAKEENVPHTTFARIINKHKQKDGYYFYKEKQDR